MVEAIRYWKITDIEEYNSIGSAIEALMDSRIIKFKYFTSPKDIEEKFLDLLFEDFLAIWNFEIKDGVF